jgi:hypothetical protein
MIKRLLILVMAGMIAFSTVSGCQQMGKWTGEAAEEVEEGAEEFEEGYEGKGGMTGIPV